MKTKLIPLNDEILVKPKEKQEQTAGGIYIPQTVDNDSVVLGEVLAVSEGVMVENGQLIPHGVKAGDVVLFDKRGATEFKYDGESFLVMSYRSLRLKIEKSNC
jgi:chaperonin GroES